MSLDCTQGSGVACLLFIRTEHRIRIHTKFQVDFGWGLTGLELWLDENQCGKNSPYEVAKYKAVFAVLAIAGFNCATSLTLASDHSVQGVVYIFRQLKSPE
jgi:hypothetical protein